MKIMPCFCEKTGNIFRKFLTIILREFDKNFGRLQDDSAVFHDSYGTPICFLKKGSVVKPSKNKNIQTIKYDKLYHGKSEKTTKTLKNDSFRA